MNTPLKIKIIQSGKKQKEIAKSIGIQPSYLSNIVQELWKPRPPLQAKFAKVLKCKISDIF